MEIRSFFVPKERERSIMKHITSRQIALNGLIAGLYAVVTILTASFAYGNIQFRLAEALCLLVALEPTLTVGLTLGCLIANLFSTVSALDIIVGTAATLLACLLTRYIKNTWLLPLPTILCNMLMVGAMLGTLHAGRVLEGTCDFRRGGRRARQPFYTSSVCRFTVSSCKTGLMDKLLARMIAKSACVIGCADAFRNYPGEGGFCPLVLRSVNGVCRCHRDCRRSADKRLCAAVPKTGTTIVRSFRLAVSCTILQTTAEWRCLLFRGGRWMFVVLTAVYLALVIYAVAKKLIHKRLSCGALAALRAALIGNLIDRVQTVSRSITMICIPWFSTFNVADIFITFAQSFWFLYSDQGQGISGGQAEKSKEQGNDAETGK